MGSYSDRAMDSKMKVFAGDVIIEEGKKYSILCQIIKGRCRVERTVINIHTGIPEKQLLTNLGSGEVFGEATFLSESQSTASVVADIDTEIMYITRNQLDVIAGVSPLVVIKFLHHLCETLSRRITKQRNRNLGSGPPM